MSADDFRDSEYRIRYERVADDGCVELYDEHNDLLGWHRNDVKPFGADDPQAPIPTHIAGRPYPKAEEPQ